MLGNRTGWIIALVVLALECAGVYFALSVDAYAEPTPITSPQSLAAIQLPAIPAWLAKESGTADAGALYQSAITEYLGRTGEVETMIRDSDRASLSKLSAIDKVLAARSAHGNAIFADHLEQIIAYGETNALQAIVRLGEASYRLGFLQGRRPADRARALEYYEATFVLGRRLAEERLTWREYDAGVGLMSSSGAAMVAELNKQTDRSADAAALQAYLEAQQAQYKQLIPIFEALYTNNDEKIAIHAGDVFAFAGDSKEAMFRVEAILKLGRMRYNPGVPPMTGNQRQALRLARQLKDSADPAVRRAAELAYSLSIEQFRTIR